LIGIIDYGLGNINSFVNILNLFEKKFCVVSSVSDFKNLSKIILPGVGSFDKAISLLNSKKFADPLIEKVLIERIPILGVCVGMQVMAKLSEEGSLKGFGWIDERVKLFGNNLNLPVPHMGWNDVVLNSSIDIFNNIENLKFYFLHSYYFSISNKLKITGITSYGINFISAFKFKNIYGIQFHPEKSHSNGIKLLNNFCNLQ
jgi:glutamine amidotransferase